MDNLKDIEETVARHKASLCSKVEAASVSTISKTPFNVLVYRECLFYRHTQLCETSLQLVKQGTATPAVVLARAAIECTGMIYWAHKKLLSYRNSVLLSDIDKFFLKALMGSKAEELMGSKTEDNLRGAHNVMTGLDHVDVKYNGLRKLYDQMSEFAHPNYAGVHQSYAKIDYDKYTVAFKYNNDKTAYQHKMAVNAVGGSLVVFEVYYNAIAKEMSEFVLWCENQ